MTVPNAESIFREGERVVVFNEEKGVMVKETRPRIFLVRFEDGKEVEVDYSEIGSRRGEKR
jgi:hypothetical protein